MKKVTELVLALGEKTNHHHTIYGDIAVYEDTPEYKVFKTGLGKLTHQEHDLTVFTKEKTVSSNQVEFDPFEAMIRKVMD